MRVRLLSPYPLIAAANGRPIDPPAIVEIPDDMARALESQFLLEPAPGEAVTAEATVTGWNDPPAGEPAPESAQPGLPLGGEKPAVDLDVMTKAELIAYAKAEFDLELDEKLLKAELIAAIEAAEAKKA